MARKGQGRLAKELKQPKAKSSEAAPKNKKATKKK